MQTRKAFALKIKLLPLFGGDFNGLKMSLKERLLKHSIPVPESGCWLWTASVKCNGWYGQIIVNGKNLQAHRASYTEFVGDIPDGLLVCHKCDVSTCINPDHLFLGTQKDSMQDMISKGRNENCLRGVLTRKQVLKIRQAKGTCKKARQFIKRMESDE